MRTKRIAGRFVMMGALLSMVLLLVGGPLVPDAEARKRHRKPAARKVVKRVHHPVAVRHHRPRPVPVYREPVYVRVARPWYYTAPRVYVHHAPFYYHAGLNVYLGGITLGFGFGNAPPAGFVYYDPYCGREFRTVSRYHRHLRRHPHAATLEVVRVGWRGY
jgi:hypothetical protein